MNRVRKVKQSSKLNRTITAEEAMNNFDELLSEVQDKGAVITVKQSGTAIAQLVPYISDIVGCMAGTFKITGDIISPEPDVWDAMDDSKSLYPAQD